ncbi:adhesin transport system membrane fusion protein [Enterobacter sp. BIGb0383]|nr:adhesin transport system membrane fusion protein [Enterobacter sp. BIGb0383]ROS09180.1 adhesin transport system membrane fusion protein [Enterobacter sp. BIGb0359]
MEGEKRMASQSFWARVKGRVAAVTEFIQTVFIANRKQGLAADGAGIDDAVAFSGVNEVSLSGARRVIFIIIAFLALFAVWCSFFSIDEVSKGNGKVIPGSKEQVIQSLDGGVLERIYVKEGQIVEAGEILAQLDVVRTESTFEEYEAKYRALLAQQVRLSAEGNGTPLAFPETLSGFPVLVEAETRLYTSRKTQFEEAMQNIADARKLIKNELAINTRLAKEGASSTVEVIRLRRQLVDLNMKVSELQANYHVKSREELSKVSAEISGMTHGLRGRQDLVSKSTLRSPVRGIIKDIEINTIGGTLPPNGAIMRIVPLDDTLLIEAQILPRDIAFIHPGQKARVKITAYDYSIYGDLPGEVITISPDTIKDEQKPDVVYYRAYIRTAKDYLLNKQDRKLFISPGMVASVDIVTGRKTIARYLIKPFNKVNEALTER